MPRDYQVEVDPHVVFELGETLITDDIGAIVELVKNAYDADATTARVTIDATGVPPRESFFPNAQGYVLVEDDGAGMTEADIRRGWLTVAYSGKRDSKARGERTPVFGRTPLGDKGLGRLGTQRLGYVVELFTTKRTGAQDGEHLRYHVGIDWRDFDKREHLSDVPVKFRQSMSHLTGTRVLVSQLRQPGDWSSDAYEELQRRLSQFIFPFEGQSNFRVLGTLNGHPLDLLQISRELLRTATIDAEFAYAQGVLRTTVKYRISALRPQARGRQLAFENLVLRDRGKALYRHLNSVGKAPGKSQYLRGEPWFVEVSQVQDVSLLAGLQYEGNGPADPGPFSGRLAAFDLGRASVREAALSDYRRIVQSQAGVKVFRDGFAVRPYGMDGNDWLRLGSSQTSGGSYYGLRPGNTIGYVSISADVNAQLQEKTDREGFTDTPYARNLQILVGRAVTFVNSSSEWLRRGFNDMQARAAGQTSKSGTAPFEAIRRASTVATNLESDAAALRVAAGDLEGAVEGLAQSTSPKTAREAGLSAISRRVNQLVDALDREAKRLTELTAASVYVEGEVRRLNEELQSFTELAALGLSVEAVAHELRNIVEGLNQRTRNLVRTRSGSPTAVAEYTAFVRTTVTALRKQLSHIAPTLRYVREQRDTFSLDGFIQDFAAFHQAPLRRRGIDLVTAGQGPDAQLKMNRGRLTQVLDNLVMNSRYWLLQPVNMEREHVVHIEREGASIFFWDSGVGIDPAIEPRLFEPFVTNKPAGVGRGLGLFIARRLLEPYGCTIELSADRNDRGNRYRFLIDLSGAARDEPI